MLRPLPLHLAGGEGSVLKYGPVESQARGSERATSANKSPSDKLRPADVEKCLNTGETGLGSISDRLSIFSHRETPNHRHPLLAASQEIPATAIFYKRASVSTNEIMRLIKRVGLRLVNPSIPSGESPAEICPCRFSPKGTFLFFLFFFERSPPVNLSSSCSSITTMRGTAPFSRRRIRVPPLRFLANVDK